MKIKTSELIGAQLDWAVAAALEVQFNEGRVVKVCRQEETFPAWIELENWPGSAPNYHRFSPSTDWHEGGPILGDRQIHVAAEGDPKNPVWVAGLSFTTLVEYVGDRGARRRFCTMRGPSYLIAAMRCYVASKLGDEVEVPDGLA